MGGQGYIYGVQRQRRGFRTKAGSGRAGRRHRGHLMNHYHEGIIALRQAEDGRLKIRPLKPDGLAAKVGNGLGREFTAFQLGPQLAHAGRLGGFEHYVLPRPLRPQLAAAREPPSGAGRVQNISCEVAVGPLKVQSAVRRPATT